MGQKNGRVRALGSVEWEYGVTEEGRKFLKANGVSIFCPDDERIVVSRDDKAVRAFEISQLHGAHDPAAAVSEVTRSLVEVGVERGEADHVSRIVLLALNVIAFEVPTGPVAIKSAVHGCFLRADGRGNPRAIVGPGFGIVNCQGAVGAWERFEVIPRDDGWNTFAIKSTQFDCFLRMDAQDTPHSDGNGYGILNCQGGVAAWETFWFESKGDGTFSIRSCHWSSYVRADGRGGLRVFGPGYGTVNCQGFASAWEKFTFVA